MGGTASGWVAGTGISLVRAALPENNLRLAPGPFHQDGHGSVKPAKPGCLPLSTLFQGSDKASGLRIPAVRSKGAEAGVLEHRRLDPFRLSVDQPATAL